MISFILKSGFLNLPLHDLSGYLIQFSRHGIKLCLNHRTRFINQVNCLIRQETIGDITVRKCCGTNQCAITDLDTVEHFIPVLNTTQDGNCIFHSWLIYHNRLETTLQCRILLDVFPVFIQRCRTDTMQFASCKHRLQHITRIHRTFCLTGSNDCMNLIDKQNQMTFGIFHFIKDCLQTLLELATILGACQQRTHIQCENIFILQ